MLLDYSLLLRLILPRIPGAIYDINEAAKRSARFSGHLFEQAWVLAEL
jgi:hypothetical protein